MRKDRAIAYALSAYEMWVKRVKSAPFKVLTEDEWLEACTYFGGCALCRKKEIDVRGFFLPFVEGGRYTAWNVIPLCKACGHRAFRSRNPFEYNNIAAADRPSRCGYTIESLNNTVYYLESKLPDGKRIFKGVSYLYK